MSFSFCPVKTLPEWKNLISKVPEDVAYGIWYVTGGEQVKIDEYLFKINQKGVMNLSPLVQFSEQLPKYIKGNVSNSDIVLNKIQEKTVGLGKVAEKLSKINASIPIVVLNTDKINKNSLPENVPVSENLDAVGLYSSYTNTIYIAKNGEHNQSIESVLLHEILHAYTFYFTNNKESEEVKHLQRILDYLKSEESKIKDKYPLSNIDELLVAVFTNSSFIKDLKTIPSLTKGYQTLWDEVLNVFKSIFNIEEDTIFEELFNVSSAVVDKSIENIIDYNKKLQQEKELNTDTKEEFELRQEANDYLYSNLSPSRQPTGFETVVYEADVFSVHENKVFYTTDKSRAKNPNLPIIVDRFDLISNDTNVNKQNDLFLIDVTTSFYQKLIDVDYSVEADNIEKDLSQENAVANGVIDTGEVIFTPRGINIVISQFDNSIEELRKAKKIVESKPKSDLNIKIIYGYETKINELIQLKKEFIKNSTLDNLLVFGDVLENYLANLIKIGDERDLESIQQMSTFLEALYQIKGKNIVFDDTYFGLDANRDKIAKKYNKLAITLDKKEKFLEKILLNFVKRNSQGTANLTMEDILSFGKDIGMFNKNLLDLSKVNQPLIQALQSALKKASSAAKQESSEIFEKLDQLERKARNKAKELGTNIDELMRQKDGQYYTGRTVSVFSASYWNKVVGMNAKQHIQFMSENEIVFNPFLLFNDLERTILAKEFEGKIDSDYANDPAYKNNPDYLAKKREEHIKELKETLGKDYNKFYKEAEEKILHYFQNKDIVFSVIDNDATLEDKDKNTKKEKWLEENSPFRLARKIELGAALAPGDKTNYHNAIRKYSTHVPRKTIKGIDTGYYDKNYATIRNNKELQEYHDFYLKTLKDITFILPPSKRNMFKGNSLPFLKATLMERLTDGNVHTGKKAFNDMYDSFLSTFASEEGSTYLSEYVDPVTGLARENFQLSSVGSIDYMVQQELDKYEALYYTKEKKGLTSEQRDKARREITDKIARENTTDTVKLLRVYTMMGLAYKHKEGMETLVNVVRDKVYSAAEAVTTRQGNIKKDENDIAGKKQGLNNLKELLDYTISTVYYGKSPTIEQGVGSTKRYTPEEKEKVSEIEAGIAAAKAELEVLSKVDLTTYNEQETEAHENKIENLNKSIEVLNRSKDKLGKVVVLSKIVDNYFLKWFRSVSLGYNISGAIFNGTVGFMNNWVEAANGRYFDDDHLEKAYVETRKSYTNREDFEKRGSLMRVYDVLKKSSDELAKSTAEGKFSRKYKTARNTFGLYAFMNNTEYLNQVPILYAMLIKEQITDKNGKVSSLLDAYDKNGKLKSDFRTEQNIADWETPSPDNKYAKLKLKLDYAISAVHGNYDLDSPILANKTVMARSAIMFRKWMFEGVNNRFRAEEFDSVLGQKVKGRYRSGFGMFVWDGSFRERGVSFTDKSAFMLKAYMKLFAKQTLRNIPGVTISDNLNKTLSVNLEEYLNDVDAQNVRANMVESIMLLQLLAISTILYAVTKGEDDDEEKQLSAINITINILNRLSSDMSFYFNPNEGIRMLDAIVPATGLFPKVGLFIESLFREEYELESGPYKGWDARYVRAGQITPVVNKFFSGIKISSDVNDKTFMQEMIDEMQEED